jgi:hypothetical protein
LHDDMPASNCLDHGTAPPLIQHTCVHVGALASHHYTCHSFCLQPPPSDPSKDMQITNCEPRGRVMEVCRRLLTADGRFQFQDSGHGDRSEKAALWRVFLKAFRFSPISSVPPNVPHILAYDWGWKMFSLEATHPET